MQITRLHIENFRSIRNLEVDLGETTVFIGPNNAGKTAIVDAVRIVLTRRWGQRGTGFTENDVHRSDPDSDPRKSPPIKIVMVMEETEPDYWDADMVAVLQDILGILPDGRNLVTLQVTCEWNEEKDAFDPVWQFLDAAGNTMQMRRRAVNFAGFFNYMPLFWLGPLRDAAREFTPRSNHWKRLLRSVHIPEDLEADVLRSLEQLDARIVEADPKLSEIAESIGQATRVAIGEGPGAARLATLPLGIEEMLQRTSIVLRNEELSPWLPLGHHGQGVQSLAVIFLFQAVYLQQLSEAEQPGVEAVFAIEEPEAHLHPQAARTLWRYIKELAGQKLLTTHSPYFLQNVPLQDIRLVRLHGGCTEIRSLPRQIVSDLPWNDSVGRMGALFFKDESSQCVAARGSFNKGNETRLDGCYKADPEYSARASQVRKFRHRCRVLLSAEEREKFGFHGRRVRGEIFFARCWVLVEGVTEYLLVHAIGKSLDLPLDDHGIAVIDFQQSGNAGIYAALAEAFGIPWNMIVDGDQAGENFRKQIINRGFMEDDLTNHFTTLSDSNNLEKQLVGDGHESLLREILDGMDVKSARDCSIEQLHEKLEANKTGYMRELSTHVAGNKDLARRMPAPFVDLITRLRGDSV